MANRHPPPIESSRHPPPGPLGRGVARLYGGVAEGRLGGGGADHMDRQFSESFRDEAQVRCRRAGGARRLVGRGVAMGVGDFCGGVAEARLGREMAHKTILTVRGG
jgi:hypothetical protein